MALYTTSKLIICLLIPFHFRGLSQIFLQICQSKNRWFTLSLSVLQNSHSWSIIIPHMLNVSLVYNVSCIANSNMNSHLGCPMFLHHSLLHVTFGKGLLNFSYMECKEKVQLWYLLCLRTFEPWKSWRHFYYILRSFLNITLEVLVPYITKLALWIFVGYLSNSDCKIFSIFLNK